MFKKKRTLVASNAYVDYYVTYDESENSAGFGIYAEVKNEKSDCKHMANIFFTEHEARLRCDWLCDNLVFPISLEDVMRNIF